MRAPRQVKEVVTRGLPPEWRVVDLSDIAYELTL